MEPSSDGHHNTAEISAAHSPAEHVNIAPEVIDAPEGIAQAQDWFRSQGFSLAENGLINTNLTPEQVLWLAEWRDRTLIGSSEMQDIVTMYQKVLLASSLYHQRNPHGSVQYLFGKGIGAEIALRGTLSTRRVRQDDHVSYRSHSDFELYAVDTSHPYGDGAFNAVFGAQEYFPPTKTKGLRGLPPSLLAETAESVDLGGITVLVPQLEVLILDKFIAQESTPRPEGIDAALLVRRFEVDLDLIRTYAEEYWVKPALEQLTPVEKTTERQLNSVQRHFARIFQSIPDSLNHNRLELARKELTNELSPYIERENVSYGGINILYWHPIEENDIDTQGQLTEQYQTKVRNTVSETRLKKETLCKQFPDHIRKWIEEVRQR